MLDGLLDGMRDTVSRTLESTLLIKTRTRTRSATGGSTYSWSAGTAVAGRFQATSNAEMEMAAKIGVSATHCAIVPHDTAVENDDRITVGGLDYEVHGVVAHQIPVLKKVLCALVAE